MKKKVLTILFATVLSAGMLTGCFGNNRANDNNSTQNSVMDDATNNVDQNSGTTDATNNVNQNDTNNTTDNGNNAVTDGTTGNGTDNNANVADNGNNTTDNNGTKDVTSPDGTNNNTAGNKNNTGDTLISEKEASKIALSHIKGADTSHLNIHQETEDGRTIYEGTITYNDREHHFEIDANSVEILEWDMELLTR